MSDEHDNDDEEDPLPIDHQEQIPKSFASWLMNLAGGGEAGKDIDKASSPQHLSSNKDANAILADALAQMSIQERENAYENTHGVSQVIEETPDMVFQKLAELDTELFKITHKPAFEMALQINPGYINDQKFRIMFLRAEYFDPRKAATRLVLFLEKKLHYFGRDALARNVHLSDLDKDDMRMLKSGQMQILPSRDRAGRLIYFDAQKSDDRVYKRPENVVRLLTSTIAHERVQLQTTLFSCYCS